MQKHQIKVVKLFSRCAFHLLLWRRTRSQAFFFHCCKVPLIKLYCRLTLVMFRINKEINLVVRFILFLRDKNECESLITGLARERGSVCALICRVCLWEQNISARSLAKKIWFTVSRYRVELCNFRENAFVLIRFNPMEPKWLWASFYLPRHSFEFIWCINRI